MVNIYHKLKRIKERLLRLNKIHFKNLSAQIEEARSRLAAIENSNFFSVEAHTKAKAELNEALAREETFWRQK